MEIQRTANAGVLLKLDGVQILLDGLCDRVDVYPGTPAEIVSGLLEKPPALLAFTHDHADHYSKTLVSEYTKQILRPILGPESLHSEPIMWGPVRITAVPSRHIGKIEPGLQHRSFVIQGSRCVWFVGDAAPGQWKNRMDLPKPDVLIAPYAYANSAASWEMTRNLTDKLILLHMPEGKNDPYGLWAQVENTIQNDPSVQVWIPEIGEKIAL